MTRVGLRGQLGIFSLLFAAGMWMSKVAQPLHFEQANALVAFGIGYAVMAVVGGLSFVWGVLADRLGGLNTMRIGTFAYAIGLAGRVFTDTLPAILFSAVAGAGASMALVGIRPWIRSRALDDEIPRIVGGRNLGNQAGVFLGTLGAAGIFSLGGDPTARTRTALLLAAAIVVIAALWLCFLVRSGAPRPQHDESATLSGSRAYSRSVAARLAIVGLLSGFYVSLITPYLPLYLTTSGSSESGAAIIVAVMSLAQIAVTAVIARSGIGRRPYVSFVVAEGMTGVLTGGIALAIGVSVMLMAVLFILRAAFVSLAVSVEETIQYAVLPKASAGMLFGISQTAFLVGDALGGAVGGPVWNGLGPEALSAMAAVVTLVNACLLPILLRPARTPEPSIAADAG